MTSTLTPFVRAAFFLLSLGAALAAGCDGNNAGDGDGDGDGDCAPQCDLFGQPFECGDDGCGGSCGTCPAGETCGGIFGVECIEVPPCEPQCSLGGQAFECGDDGCGGSCGTCPVGETCGGPFGVECVEEPPCVPQCTFAGQAFECGDDGCGGSCGTCPDGEVCGGFLGFECVEVAPCAPSCTVLGLDRECGDDGCGGSCGMCDPGEACWGFGFDEENGFECRCVPDCDGKQCGDDGCGGTCGTCPGGDAACDVPTGQCACTPMCLDVTGAPLPCGDDGCGGLCPDNCGPGDTCLPDEQQCVCSALVPLAEDLPVTVYLRQKSSPGNVIVPNAAYLYARVETEGQIDLASGSTLSVTSQAPHLYNAPQCNLVTPVNDVCADLIVSASGSTLSPGRSTLTMTAANDAACLAWMESVWATGFTVECAGDDVSVDVTAGLGAPCDAVYSPDVLSISYTCEEIGGLAPAGVCGN